MRLSIITINRNNSLGLEKTIKSVISQPQIPFEYIIVDGASNDGSVEVIQKYEQSLGNRLKWISEPDKGIYEAMNKGVRMATGDYVQFLNSGDCLAGPNVVSSICQNLEANDNPPILYGNMLKQMKDGVLLRDKCFAGQEITFIGFYTGTLNHSASFIRKDLFAKYGLYDESLKIVSDWKWFLQAIILGGEKPVYVDLDVTVFDMTGISETNKTLDKAERNQVLEGLINPRFLSDYNRWGTSIQKIKRVERHPWAKKIVWAIERILFKMEKRDIKRKLEHQYR